MIDAQEYQRRVAEEVKQYELWNYEQLLERLYGFENQDYGKDFVEFLDVEVSDKDAEIFEKIYIKLNVEAIRELLDDDEDYQTDRVRSDYYDNQRREGLYE